MQNKTFIPPEKLSSKSFTLIELIVVIIIVGILAAVGMTQYTSMVEKGRGAEARMILGQVRKLAFAYWLENGSLLTMTDADVGVGTDSDQVPTACRSTNYFRYYTWIADANRFGIAACRCTSGGKTPNGTSGGVWLESYFNTGVTTWYHDQNQCPGGNY